jgi:hypothetical protein
MSYSVIVDSKDLLFVVTAANEKRRAMPPGAAKSALTEAIQNIVAAGHNAYREAEPFASAIQHAASGDTP